MVVALNGCTATANVEVSVLRLIQVTCPWMLLIYGDDQAILLVVSTSVGGIYSGFVVNRNNMDYYFDPSVGTGYYEMTYCYVDPITNYCNCYLFKILVKSITGPYQKVCIREGWSIVSSYKKPYNDDITEIFSDPVSQDKVVIVLGKDGFCWPSQNSNPLPG